MGLLLDWFLAALPILTVLALMLGRRWGGASAGAVGWLVALLVAALRFGADWPVLAYAQLKGLLLSLFVLYIIWAALLFYRVTDEAGAVEAVGAGLPHLTSDRGLQALLLGWAFSAFLQGVGGFGVPVAVVAPLLVGLGFSPLAAVVIPSVGHAWAVTFGSLGASFYALMAATGRSGAELAPWSAALLGLACLGCGAGTLWAADRKRAWGTNIVPLFVIGLAMAGTQFLTVTNGLWPIGGMMGGLAGLTVGTIWAMWRRGGAEGPGNRGTGEPGAGNRPQQPATNPHSAIRNPQSAIPNPQPATRNLQSAIRNPQSAIRNPQSAIRNPQSPARNPQSAIRNPQSPIPLWALVPYVLLVGIVLVAQLVPPVRDFLGQVVIRVEFPALITGRGWVTPAGEGRSIDVFGHAGALLVYASLLTYGLFRWRGRYVPGAGRRIAWGVIRSASRSSLGIAAMVGMAATMEHAGMTYLLAEGVARAAGPTFPLVSPFIGALGAFMTGSNTNSNVVFGELQQQVAAFVGVSPLVILAAQTAGGAIGSLFAPAKIIVGCSTVELGGEEGPVLRAAMRYGLLIVAGLALATGLVIALGGT